MNRPPHPIHHHRRRHRLRTASRHRRLLLSITTTTMAALAPPPLWSPPLVPKKATPRWSASMDNSKRGWKRSRKRKRSKRMTTTTRRTFRLEGGGSSRTGRAQRFALPRDQYHRQDHHHVRIMDEHLTPRNKVGRRQGTAGPWT